MTGVRYVLHVVVEIAERIERVAERDDVGLRVLVREMLPGSVSATRVVEEAIR